MRYFVRIIRLGDANECYLKNCCRATFWNKEIAISKDFYNDLLLEKNVMLIPEMHADSNLIPNLEVFFEKTIDFTVVDIESKTDKKVLICELNAYFTSIEQPF